MNILKTKRVKMSLDAIQNDMTRDEMKGIIAGSSINNGCMQGSNYSYDQNAYNISMSGSGGSYGTNSAYQQSVATYSAYNSVAWSTPTSSTTPVSSLSSTTWAVNANGNYATSDSADIARFMEMITSPNTISNQSIENISSFIKGEMAVMTQIAQMTQTTQLTGTISQTGINDVSAIKALQSQNYIQLQEIVVTKGYNKIVSGAFDTNWGNYDVYANPYTNDTIRLFSGSGGNIGSIGSSPFSISPTPDFLASPFGAIYKNLISNNNNFLCLLDKFNPSKTFNLSYIYSSVGMPKDWDGKTSGTFTLSASGKTIIGANLNTQFDPSKIFFTSTIGNVITTYERSQLGKASDLIHEALHAYMDVNNIASGTNHNGFNEYRNLLINTLTEYNTDNNLGFTSQQINEMSFKGTLGSEQFCNYIQNLAISNNSSYTTELDAFNQRISDLNWNLISTVTNP